MQLQTEKMSKMDTVAQNNEKVNKFIKNEIEKIVKTNTSNTSNHLPGISQRKLMQRNESKNTLNLNRDKPMVAEKSE